MIPSLLIHVELVLFDLMHLADELISPSEVFDPLIGFLFFLE